MNNIIKRVWNQNRMVNIEDLSGMAFQAESGGHTFEISGVNDAGESVQLSGTVAGVFMRPDLADIAIVGSATDGVVSVTLPADCYAVNGRFALTIFVTSDSQKVAVYAAVGTVTRTSGGAVAGDTPQDVVDLINAINAAIASIPADYTDLMAAVAHTYSNSALYAKGAYAWYNGKLYKAVVDISTAESFTAAHWETVALADDVSELESALKAVEDGFALIDLMLTQNPNTRFNSSPLVLSDYNFPITVLCSNPNYSFYLIFYNSDEQTISNTPWKKTKYMLFPSDVPSGTATFKVICKADDEHALSETEKAYFSAYSIAGFYVSTPKTVYVSATNGVDSNDGSKLLPFKTITRAINDNATTILVEPATYSERLNISDKHDLKIMPWGYGTFAAGDADKRIVLDGINTRPLLLLIENCSNITLMGLTVINFTASGVRMTNCSGMKLLNCESGNQYGTYQYGIGFELINTNADFESCYAHDVTLDGFNIHGFGETRFVNCIAKNCGDDGISHHDACVGYISGGEYSECGKGGIASPTYGSYINIDSAYCHNNLFGIYAVSNNANRKSKALISNCAVKDNTNADFYVDYADVTAWNNRYVTKTIGSNGTFTEVT